MDIFDKSNSFKIVNDLNNISIELELKDENYKKITGDFTGVIKKVESKLFGVYVVLSVLKNTDGGKNSNLMTAKLPPCYFDSNIMLSSLIFDSYDKGYFNRSKSFKGKISN